MLNNGRGGRFFTLTKPANDRQIMKTNEIINLWSNKRQSFGINDFRSLRIYVNGEIINDIEDNVRPVDVRVFMLLVAEKQIPADSVWFEEYYNGEWHRINIQENGKTDKEFFGRWFCADDNVAMAIFETNN